MWFYEDDPVSTHSLAANALTVIEDVIKARRLDRAGLLFDSPHITPQDRELFIRVFRQPGNFFKHADRDPEDKIAFSSDHTRIFLNFATHGWELLREPLSDELKTFQVWSIFNRPEIRSKQGLTVFPDAFIAEYRNNVLAMSKCEFYEFFLKVLRKMDEIHPPPAPGD